jgi:hypothetical protein
MKKAFIDTELPLKLENFFEFTGKRFRMTKDQKERGLSRQEAFNESVLDEMVVTKEKPQEALEIEEDTSRLPKNPLWKPRSSIKNEDRCHWPKCTKKHKSDVMFYGYPINSEHMSEKSMAWIHASLGTKNKKCICRYCKNST